MIVEYKITWRTHWLNAMVIAFHFVLFSAIMLYFIYFNNQDDNVIIAGSVFGIMFLLQLIPQMALHINYYRTNKNDIFLYDPVLKEITFLHKDTKINFSLSDISSLVLYKSPSLQKKGIQFLAFDNYNHGIITLDNGAKVIITSLMTGTAFTLPILEEKIKVKMNVYRWVSGESLQEKGSVSKELVR